MAGIDEHEFQEPAGIRSSSSGAGGGPRVALIAIAIGGIVVLGVIAYFIFSGRTSPSRASAPATTAAPQAAKAGADEIEHIDLPALDDSDALVRQRIGILSSNPPVAAWLGTRNLIRTFVVVVENISHGMNPSHHLMVLRPMGPFRVITRGSQVVIDPRSYDRFSRIEEAAASIDARAAGRLFQSFKPLLQTAYDELGNQEPIDRGVERAITSLLQVPTIDADIPVDQSGEGIGYQYSSPELEGLNGAQKQLLRMGAKNVKVIQQQLRTFAMTIGIPPILLN